MKKTALLWGLVAALLTTNILSISIILDKEKTKVDTKREKQEDYVATIEKDNILKDEWLNYMESKYGKIALRNLINEKVVHKLAKQYNISVSNEEVNRELNILKLSSGDGFQGLWSDEELLRKELETNLLFEKLITKDVNIPEEELLEYYNNNSDNYNIPNLYEVNHIVVETEDEANQILGNLKQGADFSVLVREFSIDSATIPNGGKIGYVSKESIIEQYLPLIDNIKVGEYSNPIKIENGYAIVKFTNITEPRSYTFEDVKEDIKRQLSLQQINTDLPVEAFWDELNVKSELDL